MEKSFGKYSLGIGDRFGCQAVAQLSACVDALRAGTEITPVWNKSNREHRIIGSAPAETRAAADDAVGKLAWQYPYFLDADHIKFETVDQFLGHCDFYTLDVAESIGKAAAPAAITQLIKRHPELLGNVEIPGIAVPFRTTSVEIERIARKYLLAVQDAGKIYRHLSRRLGKGEFITEVSMDETDMPQTPLELLVILAALADEKIPLQTIAPKFTGRFNKGVDYVGDVVQFEREFNENLAVIAFAVQSYGLPANLKLSVHSGSDKFAIYPAIRRALMRTGAGLHLKTAGTTWLEEVIGLAEAGGNGLALAKEIYTEAFAHVDELSAPYASVIDIDRSKLPSPETVNQWSTMQFTSALRHDAKNPGFNPSLRQLIHIGYKVAAGMGDRYLSALHQYEAFVSKNVTKNLYDRHIKPLFIGICSPSFSPEK